MSARAHAAGRVEAGYALLAIMFVATVLTIAALTAAPSVLQEGKREREEEMIWRGEQYVRGIRLYFRKNGRLPQSLEDLWKPKNDLRFLRKAYTDPVNKEDGSWRLIYMTPSGQLVGSVKKQVLGQLPGAGTPPGPGQPPAPPGGPPAEGTPTPPPGSPTPPPQTPPSDSSQGSGPVFGGNIIGVGSKVAKPSVKVYETGITYKEWEFIWDPAKEARQRQQQQGIPGATPIGTPIGSPPNPPQRPPQ